MKNKTENVMREIKIEGKDVGINVLIKQLIVIE